MIVYISAGEAVTGTMKVDLKDVMMWLTGCQEIPPESADVKIKVSFSRNMYSRINTCSYEAVLAVNDMFMDPVTAVENYTKVVIDSQGFGSV